MTVRMIFAPFSRYDECFTAITSTPYIKTMDYDLFLDLETAKVLNFIHCIQSYFCFGTHQIFFSQINSIAPNIRLQNF